MNMHHFWSILAWFAGVDTINLTNAALSDGYTLVVTKYENVRDKPTDDWALDNVTGASSSIALHLICCVYTALLGKVITSANIRYVQTRIDRMKGIVNEPNIRSDWAVTGHCTENFIIATSYMNGTPHIRAALLKAFCDNTCKREFLINLTTHVLRLLDGSLMTSQSMIIMELLRRAQIVSLFTELRFELEKFDNWLENLTTQEKKEFWYLRLIYGDDRTQAVSLREVPLCSYVAFGLAKHETSTLDNYSAFDRLDETKKIIGDRIVKLILDFEKMTNTQTAYAQSIGIPLEKLALINEELKGKVATAINAGQNITGFEYEEERFPGEVPQLDPKKKRIKLKAMSMAGVKKQKSPEEMDEIWYRHLDLLKPLNPPAVSNTCSSSRSLVFELPDF
ncbi:hypothetical protein QYM36_019325 [Artemia franciscana]|uniref:Uncharacterized protein n=1 Tax=Artemia franciscana TaxID=6661 RepID=A0AA88HAP4_ARTSF|nr:hypothetical protein QYM36_019325 [Artemia franciscana]